MLEIERRFLLQGRPGLFVVCSGGWRRVVLVHAWVRGGEACQFIFQVLVA